MTAPLILGVDPGGRTIGLVVITDEPVNPQLVTLDEVTLRGRLGAAPLIDVEDITLVVDTITRLHAVHAFATVGIEQVTRPSPVPRGKRAGGNHVTDTSGAIVTGIHAGVITGWAVAHNITVRTVAAGGNGRRAHALYPRVLHDPRGGCRSGTQPGPCNPGCVTVGGRNRHVRAAWDVAAATTGFNRLARRIRQ